MKKIIYSILSIFILINGCATYVEVEVLKPAKVNIRNVQKLAVLDFDFVGSWIFDDEGEPETIGEIAKETLKKTFGLKESATPPPDPHMAFPGKDVSSKFITKIVENGHYSVIERDQLSKILDEQSLSMSGIIDENEASRIGKIIGVDAIVLGSGNYSVIDDGGWYEHTKEDDNGKKRKYYTYKINRKVTVQLNYRIVSVESGQIVASKENSTSNYDESKIFFPYDDYSEEEDEKTARANVPDWRPIVNRLTNKLIKKSIKQIAPHYSKEKREIKNGKTQAMKVGLEYAKRKLWDDAKESWELVLEDKSSNAKKDKIPAMYNLGIYYEINNELDKAEDLFDKCFKMSGKSEYLDAHSRIQKRKKEIEELEEQQNNE